MKRKIVTGTYTFCTNSNYYEAFVKYVKDKSCDVEKKGSCEVEKEGNCEVEKEGSCEIEKKGSCEIEKKDSCEVGKKDSCKELSTSMTFSNNLHGKDICQEFKLLYKLLRDNSVEGTTVNDIFSDNDCNFLNYWLNNILRKNVINGSIDVKGFYEEIKRKDDKFFSKHDLGKYMNVIDPEILENMKILYELYHYKQKILDIMLKQDNSNSGKELCPQYTKKCHETYIEGVYKCLNGYEDFCKELKYFEGGYKYLTEEKTDESGHCKVSEYFLLPDYDSVLEKQRRILTIKILSSPAKTKMIKNRWMNPEENESELLLSSTDIEDSISDNGEYNIGYYSGTT
ncbi:PIR protein [Plasmodium ovale]|uniref:PIR protein n=1 Tax=Plasmodium ovale TaxID=36330 RepID=A0A1D3JCU2_PLAOA|nr:PIR protein [Plasmodium ovale]